MKFDKRMQTLKHSTCKVYFIHCELRCRTVVSLLFNNVEHLKHRIHPLFFLNLCLRQLQTRKGPRWPKLFCNYLRNSINLAIRLFFGNGNWTIESLWVGDYSALQLRDSMQNTLALQLLKNSFYGNFQEYIARNNYRATLRNFGE